MQAPAATFPEIKAQFPEQEQLKCPRCESTNTKFCYYNNYNLSQPRHFCKNCRRYWTKGGALRNIPVGGGTRKNNTKRTSNPKRPNPNPDPDSDPARPARKIEEPMSLNEVSSTHEGENPGEDPTRVFDPDRKVLEMGGSFSSLLGGGQFGNYFDGSGLKMGQVDGFGEELNIGRDHVEGSGNSNNGGGNSNNNSGLDMEGSGNGNSEGYLQSGDWGSGNGWPDLAIYTPSTTFQ